MPSCLVLFGWNVVPALTKKRKKLMSKKLTRKGIAFGTSVAFGLTAFSGAPALAAAAIEPVTLDPNGGTSFNVSSDTDFELRTVLSKTALSEEAQDDFSGNDDSVYSSETLKFLIVDPDGGLDGYGGVGSAYGTNNDGYDWYSYGADIDYAPDRDDTWDTDLLFWDGNDDGDYTSPLDDQDVDGYTYVSDLADDINLVANDGVTVLDTHQRPLGKVTTLELNPNNGEDSFSVEVTAWVDWNMNNKIDANETKSETRTINFVGYQDINVDAEFDSPYVGDTGVSGSFSLSTGLVSEGDNQKLNTIQMDYQDDDHVYAELSFEANSADDVLIEFTNDSVDETYALGTEGKVDFEYDLSGVEELVPGVLTIEFYQEEDDDFITSFEQDVLEIYPSTLTAELKNTSDTNSDGDVRTGTKAATVVVEVLDNDGDAVAAGTEVEVTVNTSPYPTVKTGDTLTVGGTAIVSRSPNNAFKLTLATDKDGKISIPVASTKGLVGNFVGLDFAVKSDDSITDSLDIEWIDASASAATTYIMEDTANAAGAASIVKGGSVSFTVGAFDQFGGAISGDDYYAVVKLTDVEYDETADLQASSGTSVDVTTDGGESYNYDYKKLAIKDGKATFKFTYNGSYIYDYVDLAVAIVESDVKTGSIDSQTYDYAYFDVIVSDKDDLLAAAIEIYDSSSTATGARDIGSGYGLAYANLTAYDARTQIGTEGDYDDITNYVEGQVVSAFEDDLEGALVTVSGSGLLFEAAAADGGVHSGVYGLGSITLQADNDGEFAFYVYGNQSGDRTFTVKSGSVTQAVTMEFDDAEAADADAIALNVPSVVTPGTSIAGFGTITDEYGNGVETDGSGASFEIAISGVTGGEELFASEDSDADGRFSFGYSTATTANGLVTITATYDADGDDSTTDDIITKSATVKVGKPSTATIVGGDNKATVVLKNSNGQSVKIYAGQVLRKTIIATSNNQKLTAKIKKIGNRTVSVYVDGVKVASKKVSIF